MRRSIFFMLTVAGLLLTTPVWAQKPTPAAAPSAAGDSSGMPPEWDSKIPLPKGATLISSTVPKTGVVHSADFSAPGSYDELVSFYEKELPKAGFTMGPKVAAPARKVYNRTFNASQIMDSVLISPSSSDPSKLTIHIAYTPLKKQ